MDTVRALGVAGKVPFSGWLNKQCEFHDADISSKLSAARHAVAIDEMRVNFHPTMLGREKLKALNRMNPPDTVLPPPPWKLNYQEKWFPGVHGSVVGGGARLGLSDAALAWVMQGAVNQGLEFRSGQDALTYSLRPRFSEKLQNVARETMFNTGPIGWSRRQLHSPRPGPSTLDEIALPTLQRWFADPLELDDEVTYRPATLAAMNDVMDGWRHSHREEYKSAHVVQRGDSLRSSARQKLGETNRCYEIYEANLHQLDDPDFITIGQVLRIP